MESPRTPQTITLAQWAGHLARLSWEEPDRAAAALREALVALGLSPSAVGGTRLPRYMALP
jgi:predicted metal-dependent TIM-barrel fold hydrolase